MDLLGLLNIILSMMLLGIIALAGIFILAVIIISIRELIKVFISGPNTKGKK
jgi:hypothetical protein